MSLELSVIGYKYRSLNPFSYVLSPSICIRFVIFLFSFHFKLFGLQLQTGLQMSGETKKILFILNMICLYHYNCEQKSQDWNA